MIMYGIPNCNTVQKATNWLKQHDVSFTFHDYKKNGISKKKLKEWCRHFGWENILNKKGTTWQELSDEEKNKITNDAAAIDLMAEKTSCIKRPIVEVDGKYLIRFNEEEYQQTILSK
jgi:Spx/MgsR family transcriptional regulator